MPHYDAPRLSSGTGRETAGARALYNWIAKLFPKVRFGGIGRAGSPAWSANHSAHYEGRGIDIMVDHLSDAERIAVGNAIANWASSNAELAGVQAITWNGYHWGYSNKWYWRPSKSTYGGRPDHWNHVHVEVNWDQARRSTVLPELMAGGTTVANTYPGTEGAPPAGTALAPSGSETGAITFPGSANPPAVGDVDAYVKQYYGYLSKFLSDPTMGPILRDAALKGMSKDQLYGKLTNTPWWKATSDAARKWDAMGNEDPATANRLRGQRQAEIVNQTAQLGIVLTPEEINRMVEWSLRNDLDASATVDSLINTFTNNDQVFSQGKLGEATMQAHQILDDYLVNTTPHMVSAFARKVATGEETMDGFKAMADLWARQRYYANPTLIAALDAGGTLSDALMNQRNALASTLEIDPEQIDFRDDKWKQVIDFDDGVANTLRPMTDYETAKFARGTDDWLTTEQSKQIGANATRGLAKVLGLTR